MNFATNPERRVKNSPGMEASAVMFWHLKRRLPFVVVALVASAVSTVGRAQLQLPRIDPTGESLFVWPNAPVVAAPAPVPVIGPAPIAYRACGGGPGSARVPAATTDGAFEPIWKCDRTARVFRSAGNDSDCAARRAGSGRCHDGADASAATRGRADRCSGSDFAVAATAGSCRGACACRPPTLCRAEKSICEFRRKDLLRRLAARCC